MSKSLKTFARSFGRLRRGNKPSKKADSAHNCESGRASKRVGSRDSHPKRGSKQRVEGFTGVRRSIPEMLGSLVEDSLGTMCVLSAVEAARLENWGIWPSCKNHGHVTRREALAMIKADTHRQLGGRDTKVKCHSYIAPVSTGGAQWQPVAARWGDGSRAQGFRTWGLPAAR